uniref:Meteorin-like protein n=1 Tax=Hucho hucho TaxID=62062 RepID=A0A4W5LGQ2_9TELE
ECVHVSVYDVLLTSSTSTLTSPFPSSGLTHEGHTRDVEQVYLRCSQGSLDWLYPTGAVIVNLRPNTLSPAAARLSVCIKPSRDSHGANIYLDRAGKLRLLLREQDQAQGKVTCFSIQEGALFIEAIPHRDISKRITSFQYELVTERTGAGAGALAGVEPQALSAPCQPCSDAEVLLAVCTSDFGNNYLQTHNTSFLCILINGTICRNDWFEVAN